MVSSLEKAFNLLSSDPRVRCVILTGSDPQNRTFCAGMDLSQGFGTDGDPNATRDQHRDGGGRVSLAIYNCAKPVIAALNGSAVGVGVTMTLPASIRVASQRAKIGLVFARRGIVMEACSSFFLPRLVGLSRALHLVTVGGVYGADHPLLRDLFTELVEPDRVLPRALELAEEVCANCSAVSTVVMKDMMYRGPATPEETHLLESKILYDMFRGRDCKEGTDSFMEKRPVDFKGSMEEDAPTVYPWWTNTLTANKSKL